MKASNVTAGKPKVGGAIFTAPVGTPLPTDTDSALNSAFKELGYCSEDGVTNSTDLTVEEIKAWGGQTVLIIQSSKDDKFQYVLIETLNKNAIGYFYGEDNVSGSIETGIIIKANNKDVPYRSIVIDMIMRDDTSKRIVIPSCKIAEIGDIVYNDSDPVGYDTTVSCTPDEAGNTHYEYIKKAGSTPSA